MNNIKELRKQQNLTQKQLSELVGIEQSCICRWEKGTCLPLTETLIKLAEIFNVSIDYLLGISRYQNPSNIGKDNYINFEEFEIIEQYRSLPDNLKKVVKDTLTTFASSCHSEHE